MSRRHAFVLLSISIVASIGGCGPQHGMTLALVKGRVLFEGKPVTRGTVMFLPEGEGATAMAVIDAEGNYVLETAEPGDGAVVGTHKVSVTGLDPTPIAKPPEPVEDESEETPAPPQNMMTAKLKAVTPPAKKKKRPSNDSYTDRSGVTFRYLVPKRFTNVETSGLTAKVANGANTIDLIFHQDGTGEVKQ